MIVVFLNNKLISCDAIAPLMLFVKDRNPERAIRYYWFDALTCDVIRQNVVLWDAICASGEFRCMAPQVTLFGRWIRRVRLALMIFCHTFGVLFGRQHFIHFKALNSGPLRWLAIINPKRTILFEANCWGYQRLMMDRIGNIKRQRKRSDRAGFGEILAGFSADWPEFHLSANKDKAQLLLPSSHLNSIWLDFVKTKSASYMGEVLEDAGHRRDQSIFVYILGYFGRFDFLRGAESMVRLFDETIDALVASTGDVPVVLKPHIITDREHVAERIAKYPKGKFIVADIHPAVLATQAHAFVANYYSTTFADAASMNVPTIEFTDYSDRAIEVTEDGSMRPEYVTDFINQDSEKLQSVLTERMNFLPARDAMTATDHEFQPLFDQLAK